MCRSSDPSVPLWRIFDIIPDGGALKDALDKMESSVLP
jgi:hypothetical protein